VSEFSLGMQIAVVEREIRMREQVYPGLVGKKRMSQRTADLELAGMRAVLRTLCELAGRRSDWLVEVER
jgi:hypothetical protein